MLKHMNFYDSYFTKRSTKTEKIKFEYQSANEISFVILFFSFEVLNITFHDNYITILFYNQH